MEKKGEGGRFKSAEFKRRWFKLHDGILEYFNEEVCPSAPAPSAQVFPRWVFLRLLSSRPPRSLHASEIPWCCVRQL